MKTIFPEADQQTRIRDALMMLFHNGKTRTTKRPLTINEVDRSLTVPVMSSAVKAFYDAHIESTSARMSLTNNEGEWRLQFDLTVPSRLMHMTEDFRSLKDYRDVSHQSQHQPMFLFSTMPLYYDAMTELKKARGKAADFSGQQEAIYPAYWLVKFGLASGFLLTGEEASMERDFIALKMTV